MVTSTPYVLTIFKCLLLDKCEPLTDIPERTCQKCLGGGHECVYLSVEEEHRISYPPEHEYASGIRALSSEDDAGGPALSPRSAIQRSVDNVASSSTIPPAIFTGNNSWYGHVSRLPPPSTVYATPSPTHHHSYHVNHGMGLTSACDGGMWSFQSQGQPSYPSRDTSTLAFGYGHGAASVYVANQTMHAEAGRVSFLLPSSQRH